MNRLTRRDAIKLLAAAGASATAVGCTRDPGRPAAEREGAPAGAEAVLQVAALGTSPWKTPDPFLFCAHHDDHYPAGNERFGPATSLEGRELGSDFANRDGWNMYHGRVVPGFPQHPHRGFETITVVRRGLLDHSDSLGAAARYGQGDVQWLTAGSGIQHAEMFPLLKSGEDNPVELFQLWLNLPKVSKMVAPHFSMLWAPTIPRRVERDAEGLATELTLVAGRYGDLAPPAPPPHSYASQVGSDVAVWTAKMAPRARFTLPAGAPGSNRWLYFFRGAELSVGGRSIAPRHRVELRADLAVSLHNGAQEAELLMLQGKPIGEPIARRGPFVMNTPAEIRQAYADYRSTRFGGWPWDSHDPVHGHEERRFARHADGRTEEPT